jgi:WD40 repeat protein
MAVVARLPGDRQQVGSGYLAGPRLVLTADHCTRDTHEAREPDASSLKVVRASDGRSSPVRSVTRSPVLDLAVLVLDEPLGPDDLAPLRFGRVDRSHSGELTGCVAIGFPLFQLDSRDRRRGTCEMHGVIRVTDEEATGHLLLRDPVLDTVAVPRGVPVDDSHPRSPWGGLSGAVVFHDGTALGVIVEHHPRQGASAVRLVSFERVAASAAPGASALAAALDLDAALTQNPECPYRGLSAFGVDDARWFRGRSRAVRAVVESLRWDSRRLLLLGPSGSGKSSLMHAGVLPALARGDVPGSERWSTVSTGAVDLSSPVTPWIYERMPRPDGRLVVIVDQFEQLMIAPDERRDAVLAELSQLVETAPAVTLILVMRDELYSRLAAAAPDLVRSKVDIPAMLDAEELGDIVEQEDVHFEPHLAARIVDDAIDAAPAPGRTGGAATTVLPLVEFTLTELWHAPNDGRLAHDAYRRLGGVVGGLAGWCDRTYREMPARLRPTLRAVVTGLVEPSDEGIPPVRRRRSLRELYDNMPGGPAATASQTIALVDEVVGRLATARLVVTHRDPRDGTATVELTHDRLIDTWAQLRDWLREDHDFLRWQRRINHHLRQWAASDPDPERRDPDLLLRGVAIEEATRHCTGRTVAAPLADFAARSERAQRRRLARDRRRTRLLEVLLVLSLVATGVAAYNAAGQARQARRATSAALAAKANELLGNRPDIAHLLALRALAVEPTPEAIQSLRNALSRPLRLSHALPAAGSFGAIAFSPDGRRLTAVGDNGLVSWNPDTRDPIGDPPRPAGVVSFGPTTGDYRLAYRPDGRQLASGGLGAVVHLWDPDAGGPPRDFDKVAGAVTALAYRPDGRELAVGTLTGTIRIYGVDSGRLLAETPRFPGELTTIAYRPDGRQLALSHTITGLSEKDRSKVRLWDMETGLIGQPLAGPTTDIVDLAYRPDGRELAGAGADGTIHRWYPDTGLPVSSPLMGHAGRLHDLQYRDDGRELASAGADGTIRLWDPETGRPIGDPLTAQLGTVEKLTYRPGGHQLASIHRAGTDETIRLWDLAPSQPLGATIATPRSPSLIAYRSDSRQLATLDKSPGGFRLWNTATGEPEPAPESLADAAVSAFAYRPGSSQFATAIGTTVQLWEGSTNTPAGEPLSSATEPLIGLLYQPDGRVLLGIDAHRAVHRWDADSGRVANPPLRLDPTTSVLDFRPDGRQLAGEIDDLDGRDGPRRIRRWDPATGQAIGSDIERTGPWTYLPDGRLVMLDALEGDYPETRKVGVWDSDRGERTEELLTDHHLRFPSELAVRPDGGRVALGADDTVHLWDPRTGRRVAEPIASFSSLGGTLRYRPDSRQLAVLDPDTGLHLWAEPETWINQACERAGHNLSQDDWQAHVGDAPYVSTCAAFPAGTGASPDAPVEQYPDMLG